MGSDKARTDRSTASAITAGRSNSEGRAATPSERILNTEITVP